MNMGGRTYPVRYYPVAIRLRDRKGRAVLCIALFPHSGDSSGAILGVRSVALLHLGLLPEIKKERKWEWNLNKSTFFEKVPEYYSGVMDKEKQKESISVGNALFEVVGWRVAYCAPRGGYWFNEKGFGTGFDG